MSSTDKLSLIEPYLISINKATSSCIGECWMMEIYDRNYRKKYYQGKTLEKLINIAIEELNLTIDIKGEGGPGSNSYFSYLD